MAAELTRLTHKIAIELHLIAESSTICSSCAKQPVQKLLDTPSYVDVDVIQIGLVVVFHFPTLVWKATSKCN